jgi:hypothetical protein
MIPRIAKPDTQHDHISPHRAWKSLKIDGEFKPDEHEHILRCVQCLRLFVLCMESETFGAVLKQVGDSAA